MLLVVQNAGGHQRAGGAGLNAFATGHTAGRPHRVIQIEHGKRIVAAIRHTYHVVHLNFTAGADAKVTLDTGIKVHAHRDVAVIQQRNAFGIHRRKTAFGDAVQIGHIPEVRGLVVRYFAFRLVGDQQLHHHLARGFRAVRLGGDNHAFLRFADTGRGQRAFAFDLDHAGTAVAIGAITGLGAVAQVRDFQAATVRNFPNGVALLGFNFFSIKDETDGVGHGNASLNLGLEIQSHAFVFRRNSDSLTRKHGVGVSYRRQNARNGAVGVRIGVGCGKGARGVASPQFHFSSVSPAATQSAKQEQAHVPDHPCPPRSGKHDCA